MTRFFFVGIPDLFKLLSMSVSQVLGLLDVLVLSLSLVLVELAQLRLVFVVTVLELKLMLILHILCLVQVILFFGREVIIVIPFILLHFVVFLGQLS